MPGKAKHWCFTLNNPTDEDYQIVSCLPARALYMCYGEERGEGGTPHFQGYVAWRNRQSLRQCRKLLLRAHWEVCRGSPEENRDYCSKEGGRFTEYGELPRGRGARTDLEEIKNKIKKGVRPAELADEYFSQWVQYRRAFNEYRALVQPSRTRLELRVYVLYGHTGVGKTRFATEYGERAGGYWISACPSLQWFDGYEQEPVAIIDDFNGECGYRWLLRVLDIYGLRVPIKGGFIPWNPTTIFITTNTNIEEWYEKDDVAPLKRRVAWINVTKKSSWELTYNSIEDKIKSFQ